MKDKVCWGIIGSGGIARRRTIPEGFIPARNAELAVVYDLNPAVNQEMAQAACAQTSESVEALLASGVDAVYIASPVQAHFEQILACAKARKHVLCEKPIGRSVAEAVEAVRVCQDAGVQLGTAFMMRFHTQHKAALGLIREGILGKPVYARAQLSCWYPPIAGAWRQDPGLSGGGSLIDMGGHCIDLLEMFFGPVQSVSCFTSRTVHSYASEDSAVALLRFANGALGSVDTFFCIPDESSKNALELYGSQGSILARDTIGQGSRGDMMAYLSSDSSGYDSQQNRDSGKGMKIMPDPENTYRAEIEAFSRAILLGQANPLDSAVGLRSQKVLAACYQSANTGKAISIS